MMQETKELKAFKKMLATCMYAQQTMIAIIDPIHPQHGTIGTDEIKECINNMQRSMVIFSTLAGVDMLKFFEEEVGAKSYGERGMY